MYISIIEDDYFLAMLLQKKLEKEWFFVKIFVSYKSFMSNPYLKSDFFLVDLSLWDWNWFDIIKYIREIKKLDTPIMITSAFNDKEKKVYWLNLWADDYLPKVFSTEELIARIRAISRRKNNLVINSVLRYKDLSLDLKTKTVKILDEEISLTGKEMRLIHYFLTNIWQFVNKLDLINSVWWSHDLLSVTDNNINVTISKIRKKLWPNFNLKTKINQWYILEN